MRGSLIGHSQWLSHWVLTAQLGYHLAVAVGMEPLTCHWSHIKGSGKCEPRDNSSRKAYRPEGLWHIYASLCRNVALFAHTYHC